MALDLGVSIGEAVAVGAAIGLLARGWHVVAHASSNRTVRDWKRLHRSEYRGDRVGDASMGSIVAGHRFRRVAAGPWCQTKQLRDSAAHPESALARLCYNRTRTRSKGPTPVPGTATEHDRYAAPAVAAPRP